MNACRSFRVIGALAALAVGVSACSSVGDDSVAGDGRTAAVYESVLNWILDEEIDAVGDERPGWVMFVTNRSERPIDIDVQVAVVEALDSRIFVRFIDDRGEAVDLDADQRSVHDGGILVGLGAVAEEGDRVEFYADRYRSSGDVEAWRVEVQRSGDTWALVGPPVRVDVRPLAGGS